MRAPISPWSFRGSPTAEPRIRTWLGIGCCTIAAFKQFALECGESCSDGDACTNQAESFLSPLRRAEVDIHRHVAGLYRSDNANEMAWLENNRRVSNSEQYLNGY